MIKGCGSGGKRKVRMESGAIAVGITCNVDYHCII